MWCQNGAAPCAQLVRYRFAKAKNAVMGYLHLAGAHGGNGGRAGNIEIHVSQMSANFELVANGGRGGKGQVGI